MILIIWLFIDDISWLLSYLFREQKLHYSSIPHCGEFFPDRSTKTEDRKKNIPQKMEPPVEGEIVSNKDDVLGCQTIEDVALQSDVKQVLPIDSDKDQIQDQQL